ncbi:MAG TPA: CvpA family protein [Ktedonobacterales bacterium]
MIIGAAQCFFIILVVAGLVGLMRGFVREIITMAIVLAAILFLSNSGNNLIQQFLFVNLPNAFHVLVFGDGLVSTADPSGQANPAMGASSAVVSFLTLMGLGYVVGHRFGAPAASAQHRLAGILPGLVNGTAIAYYFSNSILPQFQLQLSGPNNATTAYYLPIVLGAGLVMVIAILLFTLLGRRSGGGGGGGKH